MQSDFQLTDATFSATLVICASTSPTLLIFTSFSFCRSSSLSRSVFALISLATLAYRFRHRDFRSVDYSVLVGVEFLMPSCQFFFNVFHSPNICLNLCSELADNWIDAGLADKGQPTTSTGEPRAAGPPKFFSANLRPLCLEWRILDDIPDRTKSLEGVSSLSIELCTWSRRCGYTAASKGLCRLRHK